MVGRTVALRCEQGEGVQGEGQRPSSPANKAKPSCVAGARTGTKRGDSARVEP